MLDKILFIQLRFSLFLQHVTLTYVFAGFCQSTFSTLKLRLHYVPGGHDNFDFGHRGRNGVTVTQRRGTGSTNVARRGCRDRRDRGACINLFVVYSHSYSGYLLVKMILET